MTAPIIFRGGRVVDPSQGLDEVTHLLVVDGRIAFSRSNRRRPFIRGIT